LFYLVFFSFPFSVTMVFIRNTLNSFSFRSPHPRPPHTSFQIYVFEYVKLTVLPNGKTGLKAPREPLPSVSLPSSPHSIPLKDQAHCFLFYPFHALPAHVLFLPTPPFFFTQKVAYVLYYLCSSALCYLQPATSPGNHSLILYRGLPQRSF